MSVNAFVQGTIFREYITGDPHPKLPDFPDIINPNLREFHFILAFATENLEGNFQESWDQSVFNPDLIRDLKHRYERESVKVKVVISIGGRGSQYPFNPVDTVKWLYNAEQSLKKILVDDYNNIIDGIDINYENIVPNEEVFSDNIGNLIRRLKSQRLIHVVSIAPSDSVLSHYRKLYQSYGNYIDWVDYQFYDQSVPQRVDFENLYLELAHDYKDKLLAGFSTDPSDAGRISQEVFLDGCRELRRRKSLPGIFVWDANDSLNRNMDDPFELEKIAQDLLTRE